MIADIVGLSIIGLFFYIGWLPVAIVMSIVFGLLHVI